MNRFNNHKFESIKIIDECLRGTEKPTMFTFILEIARRTKHTPAVRTVHLYLQTMREDYGAPIVYKRKGSTYSYKGKFTLPVFEITFKLINELCAPLTKEEVKKIAQTICQMKD